MPEEKIRIGQEAPDFTLRDENRQEVRLHDLRGRRLTGTRPGVAAAAARLAPPWAAG
jgi:hypothetical protein